MQLSASLAPLFGAAAPSPRSTLIFSLLFFIFAALVLFSNRLVFDVFRAASPAQSPKRRAPWSVETAFVVFVFGAILFPLLAATAVSRLPASLFPDFASVAASTAETSDETTDATADAEPSRTATQHPLARLLLRSRSTPWALETFLLCLFVATIAAPFAEEFLFRVLFQGTLENFALQAVLPPPGAPRRPFDADGPSATEFRWTDPTTPTERRAFYLRSAFAILVPAFVFSLIHAGAPETPEEARDPETLNRLFRAMIAAGAANVATLVVGLAFLRRFAGATTGDVGLGPEFTHKAGLCGASLRRFALDFYRGVAAFAFVAPFVFGTNAALRNLFPNAIVDPVPIFVFALAEGVVYWRTRRYATVVGMHVALNGTSFAILCASF